MKLSTRQFFESAHRLVDYDEDCKRIHGHNFVVDVDICDSTFSKLTKAGFLVDFKDIKKVIKKLDHKLLLKDCVENTELFTDKMPKDWIVWLPFNPTCENLAVYLRDSMSKDTGIPVERIIIRVYETYKPEKKSYAEV